MLKGPKHLWNLDESNFVIFFHNSEKKRIWKVSTLLKFEILGVFVNTLTADDKYPIQDRQNLSFPI